MKPLRKTAVLLLALVASHGFSITAAQRQALDGFLLLNSQGRVAPPPSGERLNGEWPFGVIVEFRGDKVHAISTGSHFGEGLVLTAGHVVWDNKNAGDYAAVFFDSRGNKTFAPVESIRFHAPKTEEALEDFAVLKVNAAQAGDWHSVKAAVHRFDPATFHADPPFPTHVQVWVADPLITRSDVTRAAHLRGGNAPGAVLTMRTAIASRTRPVPTRQFFTREAPDSQTPPVFLDNFGPDPSQKIRVGNSGALITAEGKKGQAEVVGVVSKVNPADPGNFLGNQNSQEHVRTGTLFVQGGVLDDLLERQMGFHAPNQDCRELLSRL